MDERPGSRLVADRRVAARPLVGRPVAARPVVRRLPGLLIGLIVFGLGIALMVQAGLGLGPWEAFHQGLARLTGLQIGTVSILLGLPILLLWWPLGERPGLGTLLNVALIGTATNAGLTVIPAQLELPGQLAMMITGVLVIGIGSGLYLGADLGPGPRDGLMTGLHHRFGWSIRRARTAIELSVLVLGFLLGGTVGLGTVVFAFGIGPIVQWALPIFDQTGRVVRRRELRILEESPGTLGE
ncbi:MAG: YczE/YyaS/YitT family protein [Chloroflexota bacterium]